MDATIIQSHYETVWNCPAQKQDFRQGPWEQLPPGFSVLEFEPTNTRRMWTYATCGMSMQGDAPALELHMFAPVRERGLVEILTAVAHFHITGEYLGLGHSVNFGRPWMWESECQFGLISLPYLDGPRLEWLHHPGGAIRFLWLIPITSKEVEHKKQFGLESLEALFEEHGIHYLNPHRGSIKGVG